MSISYDLYCPKCLKKASFFSPMFIRYSVYRLQLPIFCCSSCRLIYIDKPIIRDTISEWRKHGAARHMSLDSLYKEFIGEIKKIVDTDLVPRLGYKKKRFIKRPKGSTP